jgi:hypothetical protein
MDFIYIVGGLNHRKIEDYFADFLKSKRKGTDYELIYNWYEEIHNETA